MFKTIKNLTRFSFGVVFVGALALVSSQVWAACPVGHADLLATLQASTFASGGPSNGGLNNDMWATVVDPDGEVCAVVGAVLAQDVEAGDLSVEFAEQDTQRVLRCSIEPLRVNLRKPVPELILRAGGVSHVWLEALGSGELGCFRRGNGDAPFDQDGHQRPSLRRCLIALIAWSRSNFDSAASRLALCC